MTHLASLLFGFIGFACLCLAMDRHHQDLLRRKLPRRQMLLLRATGGIALAIALAIAMRGLGAAFGAIAWIAHLSVAAGLVVTILTRRAQRTR